MNNKDKPIIALSHYGSVLGFESVLGEKNNKFSNGSAAGETHTDTNNTNIQYNLNILNYKHIATRNLKQQL